RMIHVSFDQPFEEQLEFFRQKGYEISPTSWRDVWRDAHCRSFTVARVTAMDVLKDIRTALDVSMESGETMRDFREGLRETLEKRGWYAPEETDAVVTMPDGTVRKRITGWRMNNIYRTNHSAASHMGRHKQMQDVKESRPYWQYKTAGDDSVRKTHEAQTDKVYHADHPFWNFWYTPNGFE
ncbi:MAG: hypothetical protein GY749_36810, partial [Desulfobacteraceae bacterium]|nr:hypothetical protein [Desulfobacteraceae bacterium]